MIYRQIFHMKNRQSYVCLYLIKTICLYCLQTNCLFVIWTKKIPYNTQTICIYNMQTYCLYQVWIRMFLSILNIEINVLSIPHDEKLYILYVDKRFMSICHIETFLHVVQTRHLCLHQVQINFLYYVQTIRLHMM